MLAGGRSRNDPHELVHVSWVNLVGAVMIGNNLVRVSWVGRSDTDPAPASLSDR